MSRGSAETPPGCKKWTTLPQHKLRRKRLSEELTAQLRKHIIDHGLKPGDPLLTEQEMVERFGVSRTVVREATKALDFLGIIDAAPRRGMVLDEFDFDRVSEYFGFHFALSDYPEEKLLKARAVIETGALFYTMEAMKKRPGAVSAAAEAGRGGARTRIRSISRGSSTTSPFTAGWSMPATSRRWPRSAICSQAFFHKFRDRMALGNARGGKQGHCQIVEALHAGKLETAIDLLRRHMSWYELENVTR